MAIFSSPTWSRVGTLLPLRSLYSESKPQVGQTLWCLGREDMRVNQQAVGFGTTCLAVARSPQGCRNITNCTKAIVFYPLINILFWWKHTHTLCPAHSGLWSSTFSIRMGWGCLYYLQEWDLESEGLASSLSLGCVTVDKAFHFSESQHHQLHQL